MFDRGRGGRRGEESRSGLRGLSGCGLAVAVSLICVFCLWPGSALACPICVGADGSTMADGAQAGAVVLIAVASVILLALARFAYRVWKSECAADDRLADPVAIETPDRVASPVDAITTPVAIPSPDPIASVPHP